MSYDTPAQNLCGLATRSSRPGTSGIGQTLPFRGRWLKARVQGSEGSRVQATLLLGPLNPLTLGPFLARIMENQTKREALTAGHGAQAVAHLHAIDAARPLHRALAVGERDGLAGGRDPGGGPWLTAPAPLGGGAP